jgi:hypothetical protein
LSVKSETREFLLQEYVALREEILARIGEENRNENWALIVTGAIWGWLAVQDWQATMIVAPFLPATLCSLFFLKGRAVTGRIVQLGKYVRDVEKGLKLEGFGWENRLKAEGMPPFRAFQRLYWALLLLVNLVLSILFVALRT